MADITQWAEATDAYESPERANSVIEELVDEIKRLRAEHTTVDRLVAGQLSARLLEVEAERDAERALADQLAEALCQMVTWSCCPDRNFGPCGCGADVPRLPEGEENAKAIAAWKEARRG